MKSVYLVITLSLAMIGENCGEESKVNSGKFSILFTASINGEIEPCG